MGAGEHRRVAPEPPPGLAAPAARRKASTISFIEARSAGAVSELAAGRKARILLEMSNTKSLLKFSTNVEFTWQVNRLTRFTLIRALMFD